VLSNRIAQLAPPPRWVPLPVVCSTMLGLTGGLGATFLIMGMLPVWLSAGDSISISGTWLLVLSFPIIGAAFFTTATVRGLRRVILLRCGKVASARTISKRATNTSVNNQPVVKYVYEFQGSDGRVYSGSSRALASEEIGDEAEEPVLYVPSDPRLSTLVDALPLRCTLDVDEAGQWVSYESMWPVVWCGLAWMGILANVGYGLLRVLDVF
jgi:hypothetical protein